MYKGPLLLDSDQYAKLAFAGFAKAVADATYGIGVEPDAFIVDKSTIKCNLFKCGKTTECYSCCDATTPIKLGMMNKCNISLLTNDRVKQFAKENHFKDGSWSNGSIILSLLVPLTEGGGILYPLQTEGVPTQELEWIKVVYSRLQNDHMIRYLPVTNEWRCYTEYLTKICDCECIMYPSETDSFKIKYSGASVFKLTAKPTDSHLDPVRKAYVQKEVPRLEDTLKDLFIISKQNLMDTLAYGARMGATRATVIREIRTFGCLKLYIRFYRDVKQVSVRKLGTIATNDEENSMQIILREIHKVYPFTNENTKEWKW